MAQIAGLTPHYELPYFIHKRRICNSEGHSWDPLGENIQRAIDDLPAGYISPHSGKVWLPFRPRNDPFIINEPINIHGELNIEGLGIYATSLQLANGVDDNMFFWEKNTDEFLFNMRNMYLDGNKLNNVAGNGLRVSRALGQNLNDVRLENVFFGAFIGHGIFTDSLWGWVLNGVISEYNNGDGMRIASGTAGQLMACKMSANVGAGLHIGGPDTIVLGGNYSLNGERGIYIFGGDRSVVIGATIQTNSQSATNTYAGLQIASQYCRAAKCYHYPGAAPPIEKYAIYVSWGAENRIVQPTFRGAWGTATLLDAGTRLRINGLGREAAGGVAPVAANWDVGDIVQDTDNPANHWIKDYDGTMRQIA